MAAKVSKRSKKACGRCFFGTLYQRGTYQNLIRCDNKEVQSRSCTFIFSDDFGCLFFKPKRG